MDTTRQLDSEVQATAALTEDLAALVRRMAYQLSKSVPGSSLAQDASDFLNRNGLNAHILREENARQIPSDADDKWSFLASLGEILIEVGSNADDYKGMVISVSGALTHGARALNEMAISLDVDGIDITEAHEERLMESQPRYHAAALEQMAKHLVMLKHAIESGDTERATQIIRLYVLE